MITKEIKQQLVENAVTAIKHRNGQVTYSEKRLIRAGKHQLNEISIATFCLVDSVIGHNIPIYPNGVRTLRKYSESWRSADVFGQTEIDEGHLIEISNTPEGFAKYQKYGDIQIGRLAYRDETHLLFSAGSGGGLCDFIDLDHGYLIEAKYNYFNGGSPSGLHDAEYLLNYGNYDAELYKTTLVWDGRKWKNIVPFGTAPLAIFEGVMKPRQHLDAVPNLSAELMQLIKSGELIPETEKRLQEEGFFWKQ